MNWCPGAYTSEKISNIPSFHGFAFHLLRSLDVLNPRVGHTMDILSPFISVLCHFDCLPSVLWRCWLDSRNGIWPLKKLEWWGAGMVICLERGADLHVAQLLPLTVSCFSKIQVGFTFLVPAHSGSPGQRAVKWACVCVCLSFWLTLPWEVLSTYWYCPSRPSVVFLTSVHLALFLALSLSPGNSLVSSWCDYSMLSSLLWRCLTVPSLLQLC